MAAERALDLQQARDRPILVSPGWRKEILYVVCTKSMAGLRRCDALCENIKAARMLKGLSMPRGCLFAGSGISTFSPPGQPTSSAAADLSLTLQQILLSPL